MTTRSPKKHANTVCDCQQSQVSTRDRFKIYLHYGWSWLLRGTNNYKLSRSRRNRKSQYNRGKTLTNVVWLASTKDMRIQCDCQQSQVSTRERFKIYLHYGWSWLLRGTNNYKLLRSRSNRKTQNNRGKTLTNIVWLASTKDGKTKIITVKESMLT